VPREGEELRAVGARVLDGVTIELAARLFRGAAHWSVSQPVARKKLTSVTPGVHSLPENVLNDQQMNMPHLSDLSSSARRTISIGWFAARAGKTAETAIPAHRTTHLVFVAAILAMIPCLPNCLDDARRASEGRDSHGASSA